MSELIAVAEGVKKIDDALGIIARLAAKLKADPDLAAHKLAEALREVSKTFEAVDGAMVDYFELAFDKDALDKGSAALLEISGGGLKTKVEEGKGHCHRIETIYMNHLNRWFERVFKKDTKAYNDIALAFGRLGTADYDAFEDLTVAADELTARSQKLLQLLASKKAHADKKAEAKKLIMADFKEFSDLRSHMTDTMTKLQKLRADFTKIAGVA